MEALLGERYEGLWFLQTVGCEHLHALGSDRREWQWNHRFLKRVQPRGGSGRSGSPG